jgi:polyketide synthase 12
MLELVLTHAAAVLGHADPGRLQSERGFLDLGFDSLTALELRNRLATAIDLQLSPTIVFDHPNPAELAQRLCAELTPLPTGQAGTSGSMPDGLDELEKNLPAIARDESTAATLRERLRTLLARLDEAHRPAADDSVAGRLETATAGEIFDFIDAELGRKNGFTDSMEVHID